MSRLIDADALIEFIDMGHLRNPLESCFSERDVVDMLESRPTIDAVPVVRCENCKHGYPCGDEVGCYHPEYELADGIWSYKKDFFCAFGERKEGAD